MFESLEQRQCMSASGGLDAAMMTSADVPTETAIEFTWSDVTRAVSNAVGAVVTAVKQAAANAAVATAVGAQF